MKKIKKHSIKYGFPIDLKKGYFIKGILMKASVKTNNEKGGKKKD